MSKWKTVGKILKVTAKILAALLVLLVVATGAGAVWALIYWNWYLPGELTARYLPPYLKQLGLERTEMTIRRIGVTGTDLEGLILTDAKGRKLSVDSVRVDYVPHFPWTDPRVLDIRNITISGAQLAIRHDKSGLTVDGLDLEQLRQGAAAFGKRESGEGTMISLPLKGNATGPMVVLEKITLKSVRVLADIGGRRVLLPVDATLTSENNAWKRISAELHLIPRGQNMRISAAIDLDRKLVNVKGNSRLQLEAVSDLLGFRASGSADLKFDTALTLAGGDMQAAGDVEATLNFPAGALPVNFARPVRIQQKFNVRYGMENRELHLRLEGSSPLSPFSFDKEAVRVESFDPVSWKFLFSQTADGGRIEDASLLIGNIKAVAHGFTATVPLLRLTGADRSFLISGSGIGVVNPERKLAVSGISLSMPLRPTPELPAELKVGKILYDGREIGDTSASLYVKDHGLSLTGRFDTKLVDGVYAEFRGRVSPRAGELPDCLFEVTVPPYTPKQPLKLGEFVPALGDATATGTVSLGGAARLENGKFTTGVHCYVYDGQFDMPESGLHAEGIKLDVRFTDLLNCDTPAGQRISIGKLNAGSLKLDNIELRFDIESRNQTIVESLRADWCGGNVMLNSLQLRTDRQFWETSLYCEGLELAELVSQLNLASAAGTGALYGKIPLRLTRGGLQIGQSYLYTRPGVSNTIRLSDPEKMVNGMAGAVAQQSQFDFALEALKDFTYSWAKIHLEMQKDALAVKLQFDGQPNQALPFAYDEESGQLRRDPAARARFQGIQLNINTTIPLNYLLKLNEKVKTLTEGKK